MEGQATFNFTLLNAFLLSHPTLNIALLCVILQNACMLIVIKLSHSFLTFGKGTAFKKM
jgi:hypothetical protein